MVPQSNTLPPPTRPRRNRLVIILVVVVVALAAVLVGAELYYRHSVKSCLAEQLEADIGTRVDVGLSPKPVLLQAIDKKVPYVTVTSADSSFGQAKDMQVHARANDIKLEGDQGAPAIGSSSADIAWSDTGILQTVQEQSFGGLVTGLQSSKSDGTLTFDVGPAGLAQLVVRPVVANGSVDVQTVSAQVLGLGIPTDLVDGVVKVVGASLQNYPLGMTPQSLQVGDDGVTMSLAGGAYQLPPAEGTSSNGCGI